MVDPATMCREHLLGEHREMHALVGIINSGISIQGYLDKDLLEPQHIAERHRYLVVEMLCRGYNHHSPLKPITAHVEPFEIDREAADVELRRRCAACRNLK